jgi:peptidoglycan/LPS O-acetylase OafA/YrhL
MRKELIGSVSVYLLYLLCPARFRWYGLAFFAGVTLVSAPYLVGFPLGILFREAWTRGWLKTSNWSWLLLALSFAYEGIASTRGIFYPPVLSIAAGGVVLSAMTLPSLRAILGSALPRFLGRISFALYLVHLPLLMSLGAWYYLHVGLPPGARFALGFILFLAIALALAWMMTIWIDEPLVKGLHRLKKHRFLAIGPVRGGAKL